VLADSNEHLVRSHNESPQAATVDSAGSHSYSWSRISQELQASLLEGSSNLFDRVEVGFDLPIQSFQSSNGGYSHSGLYSEVVLLPSKESSSRLDLSRYHQHRIRAAPAPLNSAVELVIALPSTFAGPPSANPLIPV
jgi:hypothetical protein